MTGVYLHLVFNCWPLARLLSGTDSSSCVHCLSWSPHLRGVPLLRQLLGRPSAWCSPTCPQPAAYLPSWGSLSAERPGAPLILVGKSYSRTNLSPSSLHCGLSLCPRALLRKPTACPGLPPQPDGSGPQPVSFLLCPGSSNSPPVSDATSTWMD